MATLPPYVGVKTQTGSKKIIWFKLPVPPPLPSYFSIVGSGSFMAFDDYSLSFAGKIETPIFKGDLNLSLSLTEQNPKSSDGLCKIVINKMTSTSSTYSVTGSQLIVIAEFPNGISQKINVQRGGHEGRETYLDLSGNVDLSGKLDSSGNTHEYTAHLAPSS
jgi:hypothetical protein